MKKVIVVILFVINFGVHGQVGIGTKSPSAKSILDLTSSNKGFLLPRMSSAQRIFITPNNTSDLGMQVYDTSTQTIYYWNGSSWVTSVTANNIWVNNTANTRVELGATSAGAARASGTEFVTLDNGNIGIGTNAPSNKLTIVGSSASNPIQLIKSSDNPLSGAPLLKLETGGATNPSRVLSFMSGTTDWGITLGSEPIAHMYIGGTNNAWFWRANWNTTGVAVNTFRTANNLALSLTTLNAQGISGQTGNLIAATSNGGTIGDMFVVNSSGNVGVGIVNPNAALDIDKKNNGILIPRLTNTERNAISSPTKSTLIFNNSSNQFEYFDGNAWRGLAGTFNGSLIYPNELDTALNGTINNLSLPQGTNTVFFTTNTFTLTGIVSNDINEQITLINDTGGNITLNGNNSGSLSANQIDCSTLVTIANKSSITLRWSTLKGKWRIID